MINDLNHLYQAVESLMPTISQTCFECSEDDCKGYVWLVGNEESQLLDIGVEILEVNGSVGFINPFAEWQPINIETVKPPCLHCENRRCRIHELRPLNCRMYPLSFAIENATMYLVLHLDCKYAKIVENDPVFAAKASSIFTELLDPALHAQIVKNVLAAQGLMKYPSGPNRYLRLAKFANLGPFDTEVKHVEV